MSHKLSPNDIDGDVIDADVIDTKNDVIDAEDDKNDVKSTDVSTAETGASNFSFDVSPEQQQHRHDRR